jgi:hypothetical protein
LKIALGGKMKKLLGIIMMAGLLFVFAGTVFAEPYTGSGFPEDALLRNLFKNILKTDEAKFERSVGTKKDGEGNYTLYYQLRDLKNNTIHNQAMLVIQLDNKVWIAFPYAEEEMMDQYIIIEDVK